MSVLGQVLEAKILEAKILEAEVLRNFKPALRNSAILNRPLYLCQVLEANILEAKYWK